GAYDLIDGNVPETPRMQTSLYLDTARLGLTCPGVIRTLYALHRFLGSEGLSHRFGAYLRNGFRAWPESFQRSHPELAGWGGVAGLRRARAALAGLDRAEPVLLASRSSELMRLAARLLFERCRRVLVTDLEWPAYLAILERERARAGGEIVTVP